MNEKYTLMPEETPGWCQWICCCLCCNDGSVNVPVFTALRHHINKEYGKGAYKKAIAASKINTAGNLTVGMVKKVIAACPPRGLAKILGGK